MIDAGRKFADDMIEVMAKQIEKDLDITEKAAIEILEKYLRKHQDLIDRLNQQVEDEEITADEMEKELRIRLTTGKEWSKVRDDIADKMTNGHEAAIAATTGILTAVYLYNRNYGNARIEETLREKKRRKVKLPRVKSHKPLRALHINHRKNYTWHKRKVEAVVRQGMKRGYSTQKMAKHLQKLTGMDRHSAIRTVRTNVTRAESMASLDSMYDAEDLGIKTRKRWVAVKDTRTRPSHRALDGEVVELDEEFSNGLMYPGDENGDQEEYINCRCRLGKEIEGYEILDRSKAPEGMGRYEWVGEKPIYKHYDESTRAYNQRVAETKR